MLAHPGVLSFPFLGLAHLSAGGGWLANLLFTYPQVCFISIFFLSDALLPIHLKKTQQNKTTQNNPLGKYDAQEPWSMWTAREHRVLKIPF